MKDELIRKIQHVLDRRITNEKQVVYLLVEVRKLMDRDQYKDPILRTFSNWVVHTSLENKAEGSTFILTEFDHFAEELIERQQMSNQLTHISLGAFRKALLHFCRHFGLTAKHITTLGEWKKFSSLYCSIVSECPIVFSASRMQLKYIKQVELTRISAGICGEGVAHCSLAAYVSGWDSPELGISRRVKPGACATQRKTTGGFGVKRG
jgi:hypothetical protein